MRREVLGLGKRSGTVESMAKGLRGWGQGPRRVPSTEPGLTWVLPSHPPYSLGAPGHVPCAQDPTLRKALHLV